MGHKLLNLVLLFSTIGFAVSARTSSSQQPKQRSSRHLPRESRSQPRQNFYSYRTDNEDYDRQSFPEYEGDNYLNSEFGQRINRPQNTNRPRHRPPPQQQQLDDELESQPPPLQPRYDNDEDLQEVEDDGQGKGRSRITISSFPVQRPISRVRGWPSYSTKTHHAGDPAYSFGYDLPDQSRHEISDSFGNIIGYYSYIDADGIYRHISYSAGPNTGYVVQQKWQQRVRPPIVRIPESPKYHQSVQWNYEEPTGRPIQQAWPPIRRRKPTVTVVKIRRPVKKEPAWIYFRPPNPGRFAPGWNSQLPESPPQIIRRPLLPTQRPLLQPIRDNPVPGSWEDDGQWKPDTGSKYPMDASYSFAYDAGDSNRQEWADPWGTVKGSYSYIDPLGQRRTVHYTAGSATGFKILSAAPSSIVQRVYKGMDPIVVKRKPSAFVYHLHSDGGWKPWEGYDERPRQKQSRKYEQELTNEVLDSQPEDEQSEGLILDETRHEPQDGKLKNPEIMKTYRGGYGDKNPLLVMSESSRSSSTGSDTSTTKPTEKISAAKMMAMRMARPRQSPEMMMMKKSSQSQQMNNMNMKQRNKSNMPMTMNDDDSYPENIHMQMSSSGRPMQQFYDKMMMSSHNTNSNSNSSPRRRMQMSEYDSSDSYNYEQ